MNIINSDNHFFVCNLSIVCTMKESPNFSTFFNLRFMIFLDFNIMCQCLYNNKVVYDSSSGSMSV